MCVSGRCSHSDPGRPHFFSKRRQKGMWVAVAPHLNDRETTERLFAHSQSPRPPGAVGMTRAAHVVMGLLRPRRSRPRNVHLSAFGRRLVVDLKAAPSHARPPLPLLSPWEIDEGGGRQWPSQSTEWGSSEQRSKVGAQSSHAKRHFLDSDFGAAGVARLADVAELVWIVLRIAASALALKPFPER